MEPCFRHENSDRLSSSNNFIQSSKIASHSTNHVRQSGNQVCQRLVVTSSNTSNLILKTKEKIFALSPEDQEVGAILKKPTSISSSTLTSSDEQDSQDEDEERRSKFSANQRSRIPMPISHKDLPQNPNSALSSPGSSGQRPRRPRRRQRLSSKNREENIPGNLPSVKRRHSHGGVPVKRRSSQHGTAMTSLERLIRTHPIWFLPTLTRDEATQLLIGKEHGSFIVRQSSQMGTMAVSVRQVEEPRVEHYLIQQEYEGKLRLESSEHQFDNILSLVHHYATIKDELPQVLILPQTLREVESRQNLTSLALLGKDFWRYPMSFPDTRRSSVSVISPSTNLDEKHRQKVPCSSDIDIDTPLKPRQKISVCEMRPNPKHESKNLLDETLCGLQEVSDMLQASLKELEQSVAKTQVPARPPAPPLRSSSHLASPVSSPGRTRRRSDTEALLRPLTPPIYPTNCGSRSPKTRSASSRHSVCRMVVTHITETRFPGSKSPNSSERVQTSSPRADRDYSKSNKIAEQIRSVRGSEESPIHADHSILHEQCFQRYGIENSSSYYRSSVADKMSDYEDIWCDYATSSVRSITPAESENQFKAYLAQKLQAAETHQSMFSPCNNNNNSLIEDKHSNNKTNSNTVSSSISSTSSNLSAQSVTSSKISPSLTSSNGGHSSISSPATSTRNEMIRKSEIGTDSLSSSSTTSNKQDPNSAEDPVYSDPLDALEKAEDTRIYNFPDFGDEEPIYEEAKQKKQNDSEFQGESGNLSSLSSNEDQSEEEEETNGDVNDLEVLIEKRNSLQTTINVEWKEAKLERSSASNENISEEKKPVLNLSECPLSRVRKWSSPGSTTSKDDEQNLSLGKKDGENVKSRKISSPSVLMSSKEVSPSHRNSRRENRLSAVIGKYMRPSTSCTTAGAAAAVNKSNSWQVDSSSWEFLNESCDIEETPTVGLPLLNQAVGKDSSSDKNSDNSIDKISDNSHNKNCENSYDNLPIKKVELSQIVLIKNEDDIKSLDEKTHTDVTSNSVNSCRSNSSETMTSSTSFTSSRKRIQNYIKSLTEKNSSLFGQSVSHFLTCTFESREQSPYVVMRNTRQFMTGLKNYLSRSGEGKLWNIVDEERSKLKDDEFLNLDSILEEVLHLLIVRPLRNHLANLFRLDFQKSGCLQLLSSQMDKVRQETSKTCGKNISSVVSDTISNDFPEIDLPNVIQVCKESFVELEAAFSPADKLTHLLTGLKQIVNLSSAPQSNIHVEKFCFLLSVILSHAATENIEIESEFMWGLLPRPLLSAEAGYYLTLLSSSIHFLKIFQMQKPEETLDEQVIVKNDLLALPEPTSSLDSKRSKKSTASSLMTTNSISSQKSQSINKGQCQNQESGSTIIRVLIPDEISGSIVTKSLPVKSGMNTKDIIRIIAHKMKVTNTEDYALYTLENGKECHLSESCRPTELRTCDLNFVYRRIDANIIWPLYLSANLSCHSSGN